MCGSVWFRRGPVWAFVSVEMRGGEGGEGMGRGEGRENDVRFRISHFDWSRFDWFRDRHPASQHFFLFVSVVTLSLKGRFDRFN